MGEDYRSDFFAGRGEVYDEQEQYHQAVAEYTRAIEEQVTDSKMGTLYKKRGAAHDKVGDYEEAILDYTTAIELLPHSDAYLARAIIYFKKGDDTEALSDLAKVKELELDIVRGYAAKQTFLQGCIYKYNGRLEEAISNLNAAIFLNPENAEARVERGEVYLEMEDYERAYEDFVVAAEIEPGITQHDHWQHWATQGEEYREKGNYSNALESFTRCIAISSARARASYYSYRAWMHQELGNHADAIADCTKSIELAPEDSVGYGIRGHSYFQMGDLDRALSDYTRLAELDPNGSNYSRLRELADAYLDKGDYETAGDIYKKLMGLLPGLSSFAYIWRNRGDIHLKNEEYDRAIICFENSIALAPSKLESETAYVNLGHAYHTTRDYAKAIISFSKAIELNKRNVFYFFYRGMSYYTAANIKHPAGSYFDAIADCTEAISQSPYHASFYELRALCYEALSDTLRAQADWTNAKKLK